MTAAPTSGAAVFYRKKEVLRLLGRGKKPKSVAGRSWYMSPQASGFYRAAKQVTRMRAAALPTAFTFFNTA